MIRCIAIDNNITSLGLVEKYCQSEQGIVLQETFMDPLAALLYLETESVDLIIISLDIPQLGGIDFIRSLSKRPAFIFISDENKYAAESFELNAADYILRPVLHSRFIEAIKKVHDRIAISEMRNQSTQMNKQSDEKSRDYFFIKTKTSRIKIKYKELIYVEAQRDYVILHLENTQIQSLMMLKNIEERLPEHLFTRIHRSYIVAIDKIDSYERRKVRVNTTVLPIGQSYVKKVRSVLGMATIHSDKLKTFQITQNKPSRLIAC
ncbi:MAG: LytTR family DNA-binding domain-containing protein [Reichenbachiella sp.]